MNDHPTDNGPGPSRKRRLQNACDECRKRKIKCDSATMPGNICNNCLGFRTKCTHVMASAKKKRGPPKGTPRGQKTIHSIVKSILSTGKPFSIPEDQDEVRTLLIDLARRIVTLEEELEGIRTINRTSGRQEYPPTSGAQAQDSNIFDTLYTHISPGEQDSGSDHDSGEDTDITKDFVQQLRVDHYQTRHFGESSGVNMSIKALHLKREYLGRQDKRVTRRPQFWQVHPWQIAQPLHDYVFPDADLIDDLVDLYFVNTHPFYPVLYRGVFVRGLKEGLHYRDAHFGSLVLAVCAVGSKFSKDPRVFEHDDSLGISAGWKWFRQIRLFKLDFQTPPSIYELQMYCVAIFFGQGSTSSEYAWVLLGLAVRYAQDLGIHRKPSGGQKLTVESQQWNRVFWALVAIDVVMSTFIGRPRAMHADDFDLPLPIDCDDEYWETKDPSFAFKQPKGKSSTLSFWIMLLKLLDIAGFAQRTIYAIRKPDISSKMGMSDPEWNERVVREIDAALNTWVDAMPDHLRWDPKKPDMIFFRQSTVLHAMYYWLQIIVHKPFLSSNSEQSLLPSFPSFSICANAARSCIHLVDVEQRRTEGPSYPVLWNATYAAAIVLLLNSWRGKRLKSSQDSFKELGDVYRVVEIFQKHESRVQGCGRFADILTELLSIYTYPMKDPSGTRNSKRPRAALSDEEEQEPSDVVLGASDSHGSQPPETEHIGSHLLGPQPSQHTPIPSDFTFDFTLPVYSTELGSLPLHDNDVFPEYPALIHPWGGYDTGEQAAGYSVTDTNIENMDLFVEETLSSAFNLGMWPNMDFSLGDVNTGGDIDWGSYTMPELDEALQTYPGLS